MRAFLAIVVLCGLAGGAGAQKREDPAWREAKEHFRKGKRLHDAGRYDEAIAEYEAAYGLAKIPDLLFNLGQVYRLKGDRERAIQAYQAYLEAAPNGSGAADAREFLEALRSSEPAGKDAREVPAADPSPPETRPPETQIEPTPMPTAPADDSPRPGRGLRIAGIVTASAGALAVGVGVKFALDAKAAADDISTAEGMWSLALDERIEEGERAERNMWIAYGVGAAAIVTGGVLYWLGLGAADDDAIAIVPGDRGATVVVGGSF